MAVNFQPNQSANQALLDQLNDQLWHGNLTARANAAEQLATMSSAVDPQWTVTVYDFLWRKIGDVGDDMIELSGHDPTNNLSSATLKIKGGSTLVDAMMDCETTLVGVTVETENLRFAFYVDTFEYELKDNAWVGTANLKGIWDILNFLQIWPDPFLPIQAQIPSDAIFIWGLCTVLETMVSECALRIQSGLWEFINNALSLNPDFSAWIGTLLQSNGNIFEALKTPIYVVRTNPILDTSPLVAKTVRMESCGAVIPNLTKAYGVVANMDLWLPGDDQPDEWANLDQPTYVFSTVDRSQITGPTSTVVDSVIRTVVDLTGSFGAVFAPVVEQVPGMQGVFEAPLLGVNYVPPWAILIAPEPQVGQKGSVMECKITNHTPKGWQHIIGGRSPQWLNDLMNASFSWMIDSISILIGFTGLPSNVLDGFLNNAFLAFQLIELYSRRVDVGPYHPGIEVFHATSSAPYNIETVFDFINAFWDTRGYTSAVTTFRNGEVYLLGRDIFRGGLVSLLYKGRTRLYTDYVDDVLFKISETARDVMIIIGDGKAQESPLAKQQRFITGIFESVNTLTLAPQS
jgi:hypothetical protein